MASGYSDLSEIQKAGRAYGTQQKPPKINLLDERPRRESIVEQHLSQVIVRPPQVDNPLEQQQVGYAQMAIQQEQQMPSQRQIASGQNQGSHSNSSSMFKPNQQSNISYSYAEMQPSGYSNIVTETTTTKTIATNASNLNDFASTSRGQQVAGPSYTRSTYENPAIKTVTTQLNSRSQTSERNPSVYSELVSDLKAKEDKLMCEIAYMNQYIRNPWARPKQTRDPRREPTPKMAVKNDQRWVRECPTTSSSRPTSRASSTRSNTEAELMEKASKLMQDAEELERKPITPQQMVIETGTRPRSAPEKSMSPEASSYHTAIIKVPNGEIDNRSPLPFAFDNFSTLGVRGNVASVGAAPPEKPYAPIFPVVKRTPSPAARR